MFGLTSPLFQKRTHPHIAPSRNILDNLFLLSLKKSLGFMSEQHPQLSFCFKICSQKRTRPAWCRLHQGPWERALVPLNQQRCCSRLSNRIMHELWSALISVAILTLHLKTGGCMCAAGVGWKSWVCGLHFVSNSVKPGCILNAEFSSRVFIFVTPAFPRLVPQTAGSMVPSGSPGAGR